MKTKGLPNPFEFIDSFIEEMDDKNYFLYGIIIAVIILIVFVYMVVLK